MTTFGDQVFQFGGVPVGSFDTIGAGHVYYVCQTSNSLHETDFIQDKIGTYSDGTNRVHTTIQSALDATVANRNDYVLVMPDSADYDLTSTLTMTKRNVHLICPAGLNGNGFPTNAARIDMTADDEAITVTADCVEIAGFFFKGYLDASIIHLSGTRWHNIIHDNFFGMKASSAGSGNYGIKADGACSHFSFYRNYFTNYSPSAMSGTDNAIAGFIGVTSNTSTRGLIRDNIMHTGANTAVATGINASGYGMFIIKNFLFEDSSFGGSDGGTLTLGISNSTDCFVADNRIGITTAANAVDGGTADESYCENYEASSGGTAAV